MNRFKLLLALILLGAGIFSAQAGATSNLTKTRLARSKAVVPGYWHSDLAKCQDYAKKNGVPLIAVWSNGDLCGHCVTFEQAAVNSVFTKWMKSSGCVFFFAYSGDSFGKKDGSAYNFCWGSGKSLGFSSERSNVPSYDRVRELVMKELKNTFRPEFLNRVDDIIVFHSLEKQDISEIARRMLETLSKRVAQLDITLIFDESAVQKTADAGFDPVYGARPLKRVIQQQIEDKLSEQMLEGKVTTGKKYICKAENGEFVFAEQTEPEQKEEPETAETE